MKDRLRNEDGVYVTFWILGLTITALLMFALVADGSRVFASIDETSDVAQMASRAGAREVNPATGNIRPGPARDLARAELNAAGMTGTVVVASDMSAITVTATETVDLPRLAMVGVSSRTVSSSHTATVLDRDN